MLLQLAEVAVIEAEIVAGAEKNGLNPEWELFKFREKVTDIFAKYELFNLDEDPTKKKHDKDRRED